MTVSTIVFLLSAGFVFYVLALYPIGLALWARRFPRPIRKAFKPEAISIIIPVRNGASWIGAKLQSLLSSDYPAELIEILVVSDGSTDDTNEIVRHYGDSRVRLLPLAPGGKAMAVTKALQQVTSPIVVLTDVRQVFDPAALQSLVACFAEPAVGVVTGELVIRAGSTFEEYNTGLYWRYEKWIRRNLNRIDAMLGATGSIYAMRREFTAAIPSDILLDDVYLPFIAAAKGARIYFEEKAKAWDSPTSLRSEFRRKVRTQAGVYQIVRHFPWLLWPGNRRFLHFASHKLGRLMLPFAMIVAAVSSFGLPAPWRTLVLTGQALFYVAAAIDPLIPEKAAFKRLTGVIRAFVVLVAAAFCAVAVFIVPAQLLWKETKVETGRENTEPVLK
jgi:cellulose synthase/poly-beta-1,6-N-acetylglucosamine synthase-like glycosyltransferase